MAFAVDAPAFRLAAAASLTTVMDEALQAHAAAGGALGQSMYGPSSTLAKQIDQGAPVQLFISADQRWMDWLAERHAIDAASRADIAGNRLVLVAPASVTFTVELAPGVDLANAFSGRWTTGDPAHVPLGMYAKDALGWLGQWQQLEPRLIAAADARAAVRLVERGEVAAGIVYETDVRGSTEVEIVAVFSAISHPPITYSAAIVGVGSAEARSFLAFLTGGGGQAVLQRHGFLLPR